MNPRALFFLIFCGTCFYWSFKKHPFWGLVAYVFLYYNVPNPMVDWWSYAVPDLRWSLSSALVVVASISSSSAKVNKISPISIANFRILLFLAVWMLLLTPFAVFPSLSYLKWYDFFRYCIAFPFFVKSITDMKKFDILIWVCLFCIMNHSYLAYSHPEFRINGRLEGIGPPDSRDANMFASFLILHVPFLIDKLLFGDKYKKAIALIILAFVLNAIVLTGSRGGLIGLAITALTFLVNEKNRKTQFKLLIAMICAGFAFAQLMDATFIERLLAMKGSDSSGSGRTEIWGYGFQMMRDYPMGTGGWGFEYLASRYMPEKLLTNGRRAAHNTYLLLLVEQGKIGLALWLLYWVITIYMLRKVRSTVWRFRPQPGTDLFKVKQYSMATEAAIVGILVVSFFVDRVYYEAFYWLGTFAPTLQYLGMKLAREEYLRIEQEQKEKS